VPPSIIWPFSNHKNCNQYEGRDLMLRKSALTALLAVFAVAAAAQVHADWADRDFLVDHLYRYNCADAQRVLKGRGFSSIKTSACGGRYHNFVARWKGKSYKIKVSGATADIVTMKRVN
jgi:hypothetical protein